MPWVHLRYVKDGHVTPPNLPDEIRFDFIGETKAEITPELVAGDSGRHRGARPDAGRCQCRIRHFRQKTL